MLRPWFELQKAQEMQKSQDLLDPLRGMRDSFASIREPAFLRHERDLQGKLRNFFNPLPGIGEPFASIREPAFLRHERDLQGELRNFLNPLPGIGEPFASTRKHLEAMNCGRDLLGGPSFEAALGASESPPLSPLLSRPPRETPLIEFPRKDPDRPPAASRFTHDETYRHIELDELEFTFGEVSGSVIRILHKAALEGSGWLSGKKVLAEAGSRQSKMHDFFKSKPNWTRLIESDRRGQYRLRLKRPLDHR